MCQLETNSMSVIVGTLGIIKKRTDKHINKIPGILACMKYIRKMLFVELLVSLEEYCQCNCKITPKSKKIECI